MSGKSPVLFKSIATHPEHRGVYALSDAGELWCWYREGKRWERVNHPTMPEVQTRPETVTAPTNRKASIYHTKS